MPGSVPKYRMIAEQLQRDIAEGRHPVGSMLPTESELMRAYGVSRVTVRHAVSNLRQRGIVSSRQGRGSAVTSPDIRSEFSAKIQSVDELITFAHDTRRVLLGYEKVEANDTLADRFGCARGRLLLELRMLRRATDPMRRPIALVTLWMDALFESAVDELETDGRAAAEVLRDRFGCEFRHVVQTVYAAALSGPEAAILNGEPGQPVLVVERSYAAERGHPPHLAARSVSLPGDMRIVSHFESSVS